MTAQFHPTFHGFNNTVKSESITIASSEKLHKLNMFYEKEVQIGLKDEKLKLENLLTQQKKAKDEQVPIYLCFIGSRVCTVPKAIL